MVKNKTNGYLVKPGQPRQLSLAILTILNNPELGTKMGQAGYRYVKKHHNWTIIAAKTYAVYVQVTKPKTQETYQA